MISPRLAARRRHYPGAILLQRAAPSRWSGHSSWHRTAVLLNILREFHLAPPGLKPVSGFRQRKTSRATCTEKGPTASLRRIVESRKCDETMPMLWRNSGMTPRAMVSLVNGRAISSASCISANSIHRQNRASGDSANPSTPDWNESDRRKLLTELA